MCTTVSYSFIFVIVSLILNSFKCSEMPKLQIGIKKRIENCTLKSKKGHLLHVHYKGVHGEYEFDNSFNRASPLSFTLGMGQVIRGWDQGLMGMCVGEERKLVIPPHLAYGANGVPPNIPPDATLTFHIELVDLETNEAEL